MFNLVPFAQNLTRKDSDFNRLFNAFNDSFFPEVMKKFDNYPKMFKVDVKELDTAYELTAELAGVKKDNIQLDYKDNYLTIKTVVDQKLDDQNNSDDNQQNKYIRRERYLGEMQRSFYIDNIDEQNIKASYTDGILKVILPKQQNTDSSTKIAIE